MRGLVCRFILWALRDETDAAFMPAHEILRASQDVLAEHKLLLKNHRIYEQLRDQHQITMTLARLISRPKPDQRLALLTELSRFKVRSYEILHEVEEQLARIRAGEKPFEFRNDL